MSPSWCDGAAATPGPTEQLPRGHRLLALAGMNAFAELLDELLAERGQIVRVTRRDEPLADDALLVDPVAAGIADVGRQRRKRRKLAPTHEVGFDEQPRRVADRSDRLARLEERAH